MKLLTPYNKWNDVELYAVTLTATNQRIYTVKTDKGEYLCNCDSLMDECEHIIEFKKEENKGGNRP